MVSARLSRRCLTVFPDLFAQNIGSSVSLAWQAAMWLPQRVVLIAIWVDSPNFQPRSPGMPAPVLGGASLIMFGSIVGSGVAQIKDSGPFDQRAAMVFQPLSHSDWFGPAPKDALMPFRHRWPCSPESGVAIGGMAAIILNLVLPRSPEPSVS